jgi:hypothetical protein
VGFLRGGEMNGSGKSGIAADPTRVADFVAHVGTVVNLSIRSSSGNIVLLAVQYIADSVVVEGNRFALTIQKGMNSLAVAVARPVPEIAELVDSEGNLLAQFDSDGVSFVIRDI